MLQLLKASTNVTVYVFIKDGSVTTGIGLTGLVFNTASLVASYVRPLVARAALTLATQTVTGAHTDGGFVEVDSANMPGVYRLDLEDAVCATGVDSVTIMLKGATNMAPVVLEIQLTNVDLNDGANAGLTDIVVLKDALVMVDTTIATLASQTSFTLTAGSVDDDAYLGCVGVIEDASTAVQRCIGYISDYTGSSKTVTLAADPLAGFAMVATDKIKILSRNASDLASVVGAPVTGGTPSVNVTEWNSTTVATPDTAGYPKITIKDGTGVGEIATTSGKVDGVALTDTLTTYTGNTLQTGDVAAGVNVTDWSGTTVATPDTAGYPKITIKDGTGIGEIATTSGKVDGVALTDTLTTYTGNTLQTGDAFVRLGAPAGASVSADILILDTVVDQIITDIAALNDLSTAQVATEIADALRTDTGTEAASPPAAAAPIAAQLQYVFQALRNGGTQTSAARTILNDAGATVATQTLSDNATTLTVGKAS